MLDCYFAGVIFVETLRIKRNIKQTDTSIIMISLSSAATGKLKSHISLGYGHFTDNLTLYIRIIYC